MNRSAWKGDLRISIFYAFAVVLCALFAHVLIGQTVCPPNAKTCIRVEFFDPDGNLFSDNVELIRTVPGDPIGEGWSYNNDYCFTAWGKVAWANFVPADPFDGKKRQVEYKNPDCPAAPPNQTRPADFPSTGKRDVFIGKAVNVTFKTCCDPPPTSP